MHTLSIIFWGAVMIGIGLYLRHEVRRSGDAIADAIFGRTRR